MTRTARTATLTVAPTVLLGLALAAPSMAQFVTYEDRTSIGFDDGAITPDGRYAVLRTNDAETITKVIDLASGVEVATFVSAFTGFDESGPCNDAVEVTNSRAISLGASVKVIDLTATPPVEIADHDMGWQPRDLSITPDGRFAIVQGGGTGASGAYVLDVQTGAILLTNPSDAPAIFIVGNDMTGTSDDHGVALSHDEATDTTGITVAEYDPPGGGGARFVHLPNPANSLNGRPMDVAVSPDGRLASVRSEREIAIVRLDGTNTQIVQRFTNFPGLALPYLDTTFDTIVMNNDVFASITIGDPNSADGYLTIADENGTEWFALLDGTPRDLDLAPNNEILMVHTSQRIYKFDLSTLQGGGGPLFTGNNLQTPANTSGLLAGLDSVVARNEVAMVMFPTSAGTRVRIYDVTGPAPVRVYGTLVQGTPIDLDFSRDGEWAIINTQTRYTVIDTRTMTTRMDIAIDEAGTNGYPWADGVCAHPEHAAVFGFSVPNAPFGWADTVDLVSRENLSCRSLPNSTGQIAELFALGSTRVSANDLELYSTGAPPNALGIFLLGNMSNNQPLGGGVLCLQGAVIRLPIQTVTPDGVASQIVDIPTLPVVGGGVVAGSTWFAQFVHRDLPSAGAWNYSNASALMFQ